MSHVITLTSDLGWQDHYVAAIKGELLKLNSDLKLIDVSHSVKAFDYIHAAELVKKTYKHFPEQTIHIIALTFSSVAKQPILLVKHNNHFFIAQDNGIFSVILDSEPELIVRIFNNEEFNVAAPLNEYLHAVKAIINNENFTTIGAIIKEYTEKTILKPFIDKQFIKCNVTQIDNFQNAITNLTKEQFESVWNLRPFLINLRGYQIDTISDYYDAVEFGELVAFFNTENYLEIAMNTGNIAGLLGLDRNMEISIQFK
jgi:S-adenosyl-L-methionine hydrolase (adenosine-forming)